MHWNMGVVATLAALWACGCAKTDAGSRSRELGEAALKMVRIEMQGDSLSGEARLTDSLFTALQRSDGGSLRAYVLSGAADSLGQVKAFLELSRKLPEAAVSNDPASAVLKVLSGAPEIADSLKASLAGYAAALQLNMDEKLEIGQRLRLIEFMLSTGSPVTYRDLGLTARDTLRLRELSAKMASVCEPAAYGSGEFDFFIAMRRLDDVGSRFGRQKSAEDLALEVQREPGFDRLSPALAALPPLKIAFLGDSQTDNRHWSSPAHYPNIIEAVFAVLNSGVSVINAGIGGDDSGEGLTRIQTDVLDKKPDVCFVLFGGNDCMFWGREHSTVSPEKFRENILQITGRLKASGCRVVLMTYPHIAVLSEPEWATLGSMNESLYAVRDSLGAELLEIGSLLDERNPRRMYAPDGIHFSPETHELMCRRILEYLVEK